MPSLLHRYSWSNYVLSSVQCLDSPSGSYCRLYQWPGGCNTVLASRVTGLVWWFSLTSRAFWPRFLATYFPRKKMTFLKISEDLMYLTFCGVQTVFSPKALDCGLLTMPCFLIFGLFILHYSLDSFFSRYSKCKIVTPEAHISISPPNVYRGKDELLSLLLRSF